MKEYTINSINELGDIAWDIIDSYPNTRIILLEGTLGAGKTAFVKEFCKALEVQEEVSSPTFAIIHEYLGKHPVYHFDLYRLKNLAELMDIGFEEYLYHDGYKLIEWGDLAKGLIDEEYIVLKFEAVSEEVRIIQLKVQNSK